MKKREPTSLKPFPGTTKVVTGWSEPTKTRPGSPYPSHNTLPLPHRCRQVCTEAPSPLFLPREDQLTCPGQHHTSPTFLLNHVFCSTVTLQLTLNLLQPCPLTGHLAPRHHLRKTPAPPPAGPCAPASCSLLPSLQPPFPWCPVKHLSPSSCSHSAAQSPYKRHCHPCLDPYTTSPSPRHTGTPKARALHLLQLHSSHGAPQTLDGPPRVSSPWHLMHTRPAPPEPLPQGPAQPPHSQLPLFPGTQPPGTARRDPRPSERLPPTWAGSAPAGSPSGRAWSSSRAMAARSLLAMPPTPPLPPPRPDCGPGREPRGTPRPDPPSALLYWAAGAAFRLPLIQRDVAYGRTGRGGVCAQGAAILSVAQQGGSLRAYSVRHVVSGGSGWRGVRGLRAHTQTHTLTHRQTHRQTHSIPVAARHSSSIQLVTPAQHEPCSASSPACSHCPKPQQPGRTSGTPRHGAGAGMAAAAWHWARGLQRVAICWCQHHWQT